MLPLATAELAQCDQVGLRLADALRAFFAAVPAQERSVRGYANVLDVNRNVCQRALAASDTAARGVYVLTRAPGVEGLELLIGGGAHASVDVARVRQLEAGSRQFARLIDGLGGGSRRTLLRRIETTLTTGETVADAGLSSCKRLFREASQVTGHECDARSNIGIVSPSNSGPDRVTQVYLIAYLGYRARAGSMPLTISAFARNSSKEMNQTSRPFHDAELVKHLCSSPCPTLSMRQRNGRLINVIDPPAGESTEEESEGTDAAIVFGCDDVEHPALRAPEVYTSFVRINPPMRRLVYDLYMHRDLAAGAVARANAHAYSGGLGEDPLAAWDTLLPQRLTLRLLGTGLENATSKHWPRHADAARWLFEQLSINPDQYVGFRLEVEFPVWGVDYVVWFDYRKGNTQDTGQTD